jgi:hypothetical protein
MKIIQSSVPVLDLDHLKTLECQCHKKASGVKCPQRAIVADLANGKLLLPGEPIAGGRLFKFRMTSFHHVAFLLLQPIPVDPERPKLRMRLSKLITDDPSKCECELETSIDGTWTDIVDWFRTLELHSPLPNASITSVMINTLQEARWYDGKEVQKSDAYYGNVYVPTKKRKKTRQEEFEASEGYMVIVIANFCVKNESNNKSITPLSCVVAEIPVTVCEQVGFQDLIERADQLNSRNVQDHDLALHISKIIMDNQVKEITQFAPSYFSTKLAASTYTDACINQVIRTNLLITRDIANIIMSK